MAPLPCGKKSRRSLQALPPCSLHVSHRSWQVLRSVPTPAWPASAPLAHGAPARRFRAAILLHDATLRCWHASRDPKERSPHGGCGGLQAPTAARLCLAADELPRISGQQRMTDVALRTASNHRWAAGTLTLMLRERTRANGMSPAIVSLCTTIRAQRAAGRGVARAPTCSRADRRSAQIPRAGS